MKINSQRMKMLNKKLILKTLVEKGSLTRIELSRITGLTPSTIGRIVYDLVKSGFVEEGIQVQTSPVGRKATSLYLTKSFCSSIIFNVGVDRTEIAVGYLDKSTEKLYEFPTETLPRFAERVNDFLQLIERKKAVDAKRTAVVFAFPGIVDTNEAEIIYAPNLNWTNVNLRSLVKSPHPIFADNEANLSILAESAISEDVKNSGNAFFLYISQGIGGGVLINHQILRGERFAAAEIGHTVVEANSNVKCHCGNYGCFERYASLTTPIAEYEKYGRRLHGKTIAEKFDSLLKAKAEGDSRAEDSLKDFLHYLSVGIINIVNTFNPKIIILGGDSNSIWKNFGKDLYKTISERTMPRTLEGVFFRDTVFTGRTASIVGGNIMAIEHLIKTLEIL